MKGYKSIVVKFNQAYYNVQVFVTDKKVSLNR